MKSYKIKRGTAIFEVLLYMFFGLALIFFLNSIIEGYLERQILFVSMMVYTIMCLYYVFLDLTLSYIVTDELLEIRSFLGLKKIKIPFSKINGIVVEEDEIKGFKLSGFGKHKYCFGRSVVDNIGICRMFITNSKELIYVHTEEMSYGLSPLEFNKFKDEFRNRNIEEKEFKVTTHRGKDVFKNKSVLLPFILSSIIIILIALIPFLLYLTSKVPSEMPLAFDAHFLPIIMGTGKQFVAKQMMYGVLNMVLLLCMYYAAYFCAKYDKKLASRYIYLSMLTSFIFLFVQVKILIIYL